MTEKRPTGTLQPVPDNGAAETESAGSSGARLRMGLGFVLFILIWSRCGVFITALTQLPCR